MDVGQISYQALTEGRRAKKACGAVGGSGLYSRGTVCWAQIAEARFEA